MSDKIVRIKDSEGFNLNKLNEGESRALDKHDGKMRTIIENVNGGISIATK